jgi:hypothetical protein
VVHRVHLPRHIRSQSLNSLSVLSPAGLLCRLGQRTLTGFHLQGFPLREGRSLLSELSPFLRLAPCRTLPVFRPGCRFKDSFLLAVRSYQAPLIRRRVRRFPPGVFLPGDFSFSLPLSSPGLGSVRDPPSGVFRLWHRQARSRHFSLTRSPSPSRFFP